ncbi:hypothetical protein ACA910_013186 [Epithemia clementina (nom. ined.)]
MTFDDEGYRESEPDASFSDQQDEYSVVEPTHDDNDEDEDEEERNKKTSVEAMTRWTKLFACLILLIGCAASAGFLYVGIKAVHEEHDDQFNRNAADLAQMIASAWNDYEVAGLWIHEACRSRNFSRADFRVLYDYIRSGGLDFQAAEFIPNVTSEEREAFEADSRAYYQQFYPDVVTNYDGFKGLEPSAENASALVLQNRSEQPFYFPVHYVEPVESNAAAVDFDLWSSSSRRASIQQALDTWKPTLTPRLQLVQETDISAYSVLLMHPGAPLASQPDVKPRDVSLMVIRIPSLIDRASQDLSETKKDVYIYDSSGDDGSAIFLGAASLGIVDSDENGLPHSHFLGETDLNTVRESHSGRRSQMLEQVVRVASRNWTIAVVSTDDEMHSELVFVILGGVVIFLAAAFLSGWMIQHIRRASELYRIASESDAGNLMIVRELFPANVRDRLVADAAAAKQRSKKNRSANSAKNRNANDKLTFLHGTKEVDPMGSPLITPDGVFGTTPIADLFPNVTIMFADLVGFTAWSSVREPAQVFILLETVYHAFDELAKKRRIFKVETIGDCYVAAAGVPEPRQDHPVVMARFAAECLRDMRSRAQRLETSLGPDTGDLQIRIGLHSGEVTAGVLRGLKGRFQLFGDSMNTTSRMESTGLPDRIQVSQETATLLSEAGKAHWLSPRTDKVVAKGKGELQTYWLNLRLDSVDVESSSSGGGAHSELVLREAASTHIAVQKQATPLSPVVLADNNDSAQHQAEYNKKMERLVGWNVEALSRMLREIVAKRMSMQKKAVDVQISAICPEGSQETILDCTTDYVMLPAILDAPNQPAEPSFIQLDKAVVDELKCLISTIASLYRQVPFHNFEHASHVAMSVSKLFGRIVKGKELQECSPSEQLSAKHNNFIAGVTSDPMTHFACFFTALIHDIDHQGVPNATLVKEQSVLANVYGSKSVAEQNSVGIAWDLLRESKYSNLRKCIYCDEEEMLRFRQLLVNLVMATDVMDKDLGAKRRERWERVFNNDTANAMLIEEGVDRDRHLSELANRKATIVLEHVIQASDVSHTMQHWHVYRKWNERLFQEMYKAYENGRLDNDPSENWYESEKGFFDFYVIPLSKKLAKCGVFGVASDELMNYAVRNRNEWEQKGKEMVESYLSTYREQYQTC